MWFSVLLEQSANDPLVPEIVKNAMYFGASCLSLGSGMLGLYVLLDKRGLPYERYTRTPFNVCAVAIVAMTFLATFISLGVLFVWYIGSLFGSITAALKPVPSPSESFNVTNSDCDHPTERDHPS